MSASLVGSEMCIRDSVCIAPASHAPLPACKVADEGARTSKLMPSAQPVSYTHLTLPTICSV
eukprot:11024101-Alexandrium_andersonii.AAC.1